jgi:hypothetical protein
VGVVESNYNNKVILLRPSFASAGASEGYGGQGNMKNKEKKQFPEGSELERIKRKKSIAETMREHNCSEEVAERILIEEDSEESIEGE